MRQRSARSAGWMAGAEVAVVVLAAPFLLFPTFRPLVTVGACVALLMVWLARWVLTGRPGAQTPLDVPLLLLTLMVPVAVWASALPALTLPKLTGLILGLATFRATVNAARAPHSFKVAVVTFLALGLGLAVAGLVSTDWLVKWAPLQPVLDRIPRLVDGLPGAKAGIHPNELGGTVLLFLPVSLAALSLLGGNRHRKDRALGLVALLLTLFFGAVLLLTQSRSAWIGAVAGLGAMLWVRWPRMRWPLATAALVAAFALWYFEPRSALAALFPPAASGSVGSLGSTVTLEGRLELWNRALYAIQDFAFTGTGLGTFRRVVHLLYPLFLMGPGVDIGHAHNVFLQVALDLGLPGLVAYLALVGTALWIGWRLARIPAAPLPQMQEGMGVRGTSLRWLAVGIVGSLVAFH
ncbi:O-antigen ligase family protein, partial [Chloroflexota bacterium]